MLPSLAIGLLNGFYLESLHALNPLWFWMADIAQYVLVPGVVFYALLRYGGIRPNQYGYKAITASDLIGLTALITFIFWLSYKPLGILFSILLGTTDPEFGYASTIPQPTVLHAITVLYFAVTAALVEETVFRALPWLYIMRLPASRFDRFNIPAYVLCSSILFGLVHWENGLHEVLSTFVLGVIACLLYSRIRNIWPLVGAHFLTDVYIFW